MTKPRNDLLLLVFTVVFLIFAAIGGVQMAKGVWPFDSEARVIPQRETLLRARASYETVLRKMEKELESIGAGRGSEWDLDPLLEAIAVHRTGIDGITKALADMPETPTTP